jgi:dihydrodipicolinate synthase/N-acetylneuraminate lyase
MPYAAAVHVALLTPAGADGCVDEAALAHHVRWLCEQGVDGLLVAGTTGEGPMLDDAQLIRAVAAAAGVAGDGVEVVAHVGRPGTAATARLARAACAAGATALAAVVPYFFAFDDDQLLSHFAAVAQVAAPQRLFAYTIPERVHNEVSPELLERMADEGVAGIKDSTKSLPRHREYLDVARGRDLSVYMGSDGLALQALEAGAAGVVSAVANVYPEQLVRLRDAVQAGDADRAQQLQDHILDFRNKVKGRPSAVSLKEHLAKRLAQDGRGYPAAAWRPLG